MLTILFLVGCETPPLALNCVVFGRQEFRQKKESGVCVRVRFAFFCVTQQHKNETFFVPTCPQSYRRKWMWWVNNPSRLTSNEKQLEAAQLRVCLLYTTGKNTTIFVLKVFTWRESWLTGKGVWKEGVYCLGLSGLGCTGRISWVCTCLKKGKEKNC